MSKPVRLPDDLHARLKAAASARRFSISVLAQLLIERGLPDAFKKKEDGK